MPTTEHSGLYSVDKGPAVDLPGFRAGPNGLVGNSIFQILVKSVALTPSPSIKGLQDEYCPSVRVPR